MTTDPINSNLLDLLKERERRKRIKQQEVNASNMVSESASVIASNKQAEAEEAAHFRRVLEDPSAWTGLNAV